ncbi:MAG: universal stress protein [Planctomycetes bacterium]|nr:universal stress protein [Planctomycetota bacterium]
MINKFKRVVFPTDFSDTAASAMRTACSIAAQYNAELDVVTVVDSTVYAYAGYPFGSLAADLMNSAETQLKDLKLPKEAAKSKVNRFVLSGNAPKEITDHAMRHNADLIVMATHGPGAVARFFLGSVTDKVLHIAPCAVLVLRKPDKKTPERKTGGFKRILFPTDFSPTANLALKRAIDLTEDFDAELRLLHIVDDSLISTHVPEERDIILKELRTHALEQMKLGLPADLVENFHTVAAVKKGSPAKVITSYAESEGCDLIVMGSHGRTGLNRVLLGSVADRVVRHAHCPVFIERAKQAAVGEHKAIVNPTEKPAPGPLKDQSVQVQPKARSARVEAPLRGGKMPKIP